MRHRPMSQTGHLQTRPIKVMCALPQETDNPEPNLRLKALEMPAQIGDG